MRAVRKENEEESVDMEKRGKREKERYWRSVIREATRSGMSIREFCRRRKIKESRYYLWQRNLKDGGPEKTRRSVDGSRATFALVSENGGDVTAGIELVLEDGRRIRIGKGVDEETLRTVLATLGQAEC